MAREPVYSAQFINYSGSTPNTQYEVPAGFTAVVREIDYTVAAADTALGVYFANSPDAPTIWIDARTIAAVLQSEQWTGRVVVPAGGLITLDAIDVGDTVTVYVGGYLLGNS